MGSAGPAFFIFASLFLSLPARAQNAESGSGQSVNAAPAAGGGASSLEDLEQKVGILERQAELKDEEAMKKQE
jgi:hypothetical protein